jgi:hypothetical protein
MKVGIGKRRFEEDKMLVIVQVVVVLSVRRTRFTSRRLAPPMASPEES